MNCCGCGKSIDITRFKVVEYHAEWYGKFVNVEHTPIKVICYDCIQDPKKKDSYIKT